MYKQSTTSTIRSLGNYSGGDRLRATVLLSVSWEITLEHSCTGRQTDGGPFQGRRMHKDGEATHPDKHKSAAIVKLYFLLPRLADI